MWGCRMQGLQQECSLGPPGHLERGGEGEEGEGRDKIKVTCQQNRSLTGRCEKRSREKSSSGLEKVLPCGGSSGKDRAPPGPACSPFCQGQLDLVRQWDGPWGGRQDECSGCASNPSCPQPLVAVPSHQHGSVGGPAFSLRTQAQGKGPPAASWVLLPSQFSLGPRKQAFRTFF